MGVDEKMKARAKGLRPATAKPPAYRDHGLSGACNSAPLPESVKGPIRARTIRKQKGAPGF